MKLLLKMKTKDYDTLVLFFPLLFRISMVLLSLFIASSIFLFPIENGEKGTDIIPATLSIVCLVSATYSEKWVFDRKSNIIFAQTSFLLIKKNKQLKMNEIRDICVSRFIKRKNPDSSFLKLSVYLKDSTALDIEIIPSRDIENARKKGEAIADFCSFPFKDSSSIPPETEKPLITA
ncbi:MAG: hypothetical protein RBT69_09590 [Spirochaetia bacterium]|jgi:hypothetical protein|nr:hypothetical protein [Spirochaetia bacterium]